MVLISPLVVTIWRVTRELGSKSGDAWMHVEIDCVVWQAKVVQGARWGLKAYNREPLNAYDSASLDSCRRSDEACKLSDTALLLNPP